MKHAEDVAKVLVVKKSDDHARREAAAVAAALQDERKSWGGGGGIIMRVRCVNEAREGRENASQLPVEENKIFLRIFFA